MEEKNYKLFLAILHDLQSHGALEELILIGSWCHIFYSIYFNNPPEIPLVKTLDLDFLIRHPANIKKNVNIPEILINTFGFIPIHDPIFGFTKYGHPDLEIEFLTPKRRKKEPHKIKEFNVEAQGLNYLNILQNNILSINFKGLNIKLPEPIPRL